MSPFPDIGNPDQDPMHNTSARGGEWVSMDFSDVSPLVHIEKKFCVYLNWTSELPTDLTEPMDYRVYITELVNYQVNIYSTVEWHLQVFFVIAFNFLPT